MDFYAQAGRLPEETKGKTQAYKKPRFTEDDEAEPMAVKGSHRAMIQDPGVANEPNGLEMAGFDDLPSMMESDMMS